MTIIIETQQPCLNSYNTGTINLISLVKQAGLLGKTHLGSAANDLLILSWTKRSRKKDQLSG